LQLAGAENFETWLHGRIDICFSKTILDFVQPAKTLKYLSFSAKYLSLYWIESNF